MSEINDSIEARKQSSRVDQKLAQAGQVSPDKKSIVVKRTEQVRRREAWTGWTQVAANILVPLSLIVAAVGLWFQVVQSRVGNSSQKIDAFYSSSLMQSQTTLFLLWLDQDVSPLKVPQTRNFIDAFVEQKIKSSEIPKQDTMKSIVTITSFFDRVETCIQSTTHLRGCDEQVIRNEIGQYARDFYCLYKGQIDEMRSQSVANEKFGSGTASLVSRLGGCK